jgi:hypothetical protein
MELFWWFLTIALFAVGLIGTIAHTVKRFASEAAIVNPGYMLSKIKAAVAGELTCGRVRKESLAAPNFL